MRRRTFLAGAVTSLASPARAQQPPAIPGWTIDFSATPADKLDALLPSLKAQTAIVESLAIDPEIKAWLRAVPIRIDPDLPEPGRYRASQLTLDPNPHPQDDPVLLHELLHAFHEQRHFRDPAILAAYQGARAPGLFPPQSYMLTNPREFFAMTASVTLWGRASRPPLERANVARKLPDFYTWLVSTFSLKV